MRTAILTALIIATFGGAATSYAQKAEPCRYFTFYLTINVSLTETNNGYSAESAVTCYDEYTNPYAGAFTAEAHVADDSGGTVDSREWDSTNCYTCAVDTWYAYMSGVATANHCYRVYNSAQSPWYSQGTGSAPKCAGDDPVCRIDTYTNTDGYTEWVADQSGRVQCGSYQTLNAVANPGFHFVRWDGTHASSLPSVSFYATGSVEEIAYFESDPPCDPNVDPNCGPCDPWDPECGDQPPVISNPTNSPIIINFERGDYRLTGSDSPVLFDILASGKRIRIGWTAPGADEAFLCLDRNNNGVIDNGSELFGTATPLESGQIAANGFAALAEYDDNGDGVINAADAVWTRLLLWRDDNHDGVSQPSEITPIASSSVVAIGLNDHWTGRRDRYGNVFQYQSTVWLGDAEKSTARPVYDVFFVAVP
jgi:hypothetical protein